MSTIKSHIRCLTSNNRLLLAGIGSFLFIWRKDDNDKYHFKRSIPLVIKENLIGIKCINFKNNQHYLIVYTIHTVLYCLLNVENFDSCLDFRIISQFFNNNQILDLIYDNPHHSIVYLNARNEILTKNLLSENSGEKIPGTQKCILYSGKIINNTSVDDTLIIASGTVFTHIIVWSIRNWNDKSSREIQELQILTGHTGVIFSIDYDSTTNTLISASDDRSIRIWKGENLGWKNNKFELKQTNYGHEARIWCVLIDTDNKICVSIGEDSSLILWSLDEPFKMLAKQRFQQNNRLWCLCKDNDNNSLIIGGSDSSIQSLKIDDILHRNDYEKFVWNRNFSSSIKALSMIYDNIETVDNFKMLFSLNKGKIMISDKQLTNEQNVLSVHENIKEIFNDYIKLSTNRQKNLIVIGSKFGHLGVIQHDFNDSVRIAYLEKTFDQKIIDLSFITHDNDIDDKLMVCLLNGIVYIVQISISNDANGQIKIVFNANQYYRLPNTKHQWCSCGLLYRNLFLIGDYSGNILSYWIDQPESFKNFWHIHGQNGVTDVRRHEKFIYSCGRNGCIVQYLIVENNDRIVIDFHKLRTYVSFSNFDWIVGFEFFNGKPSIVYGFDCRHFSVWLIDSEQTILFYEDCGGGHRSFDIAIKRLSSNNELITVNFVYNRSNMIKHCNRLCRLPSRITFPIIPKKINCCAQMISNGTIYVLIAGEDRQINVIRFNDHLKDQFEMTEILYGHIATINSIKCTPINDKATMAISVGSRSQMIIWKFFLDNENLICQEKCVNYMGLYDKQLEFETKIRKTIDYNDNGDNNNNDYVLDIRYMDVDFIKLNNNGKYLIIIACSDATFRTFSYDESLNKLVIRDRIKLRNSSLFKCKLLLLSSLIIDGKNSTIVASTIANDGYIHLLSIDHQLLNNHSSSLKLSKQIHRSAITSFDWHLEISKKLLIIITGGDDNQLIVTLINYNYDYKSAEISLNYLRSFGQSDLLGHTCQITDLKLIRHREHIEVRSVSIDQRIIDWRIEISELNSDQDNQQDSMMINDQRISSIADISSICRLIEYGTSNRPTKWMVFGDGFELID